MDWTVTAQTADMEAFRDIKPEEILYEFDVPRIFTANNAFGELLFYLADEQNRICRYIVAPTNALIITKLKRGILSVLQALDQPWIWVFDSQYDGTPVNAWKGTIADIPADSLPQPGVMLWPTLEPFFALRAIGEGLAEGQVPASVIRLVVDGAITALKKVSSQVFNMAHSQGRNANIHRQFYDLPAQGFAYNSFEVSFRLPIQEQRTLGDGTEDEWESGFDEVGKSLQKALAWASEAESDDGHTYGGLDIGLLEALEKLAPPQRGIVKAIEIRGRIFRGGQQCYRLTREASKRVRQELDKARTTREKLSKVVGLVREYDKDNYSFTLRETDDGREHPCTFPPEFYDDIDAAFASDYCITVIGRENLENGEIEVSLVSRESVV